jgi:hypothetical protein
MQRIVRQLLVRAMLLGAIGLVAVGLSGGVAAAFGMVAGESFVAGDPPTVVYTAARCAEYHEYVPNAATCEQAATRHHYDEVVVYRSATGIIGLAVLAAFEIGRRRRPAFFASDRLPAAFDETVAATIFGIAAVGLSAYGFDQVAHGYDGSGFWLSGGVVAAGAAAAFGVRFLRRVVAHT